MNLKKIALLSIITISSLFATEMLLNEFGEKEPKDKMAKRFTEVGKYFLATKDITKARRNFKKGCDLDNAKACFFIATLYIVQPEKGIITKQDEKEIKEYLKKSCKLNFKPACQSLKGNKEDKK